jgi:hypothetical protein
MAETCTSHGPMIGSLNRECAYADGFTVSTDDPDMATLKTFATNGNISFATGTVLVGWMSGF